MFGPPPVPTDLVTSLLREHWGLSDVEIEYAPVGFGSYHWTAVAEEATFFVTLDDFGHVVDPERRPGRMDLATRRYRCAFDLAKSGCRFVRGPVPTAKGEITVRDGARLFSLWQHIEGRSSDDGKFHNEDDRRAVSAVLAELHGMDTALFDVGTETFRPARREAFEQLLAEPGDRWETGPYGDRARALLVEHAAALRRLLSHYDYLVAKAPPPDQWVLTHGEPHMANVVFGSDGPVLIDWDTVAIAPPERDLWMVARDNLAIFSGYTQHTGHEPDPDMLSLYAAHWELSEFGITFKHFRNAHGDGPDDVVQWKILTGYLPVEPRWPGLFTE